MVNESERAKATPVALVTGASRGIGRAVAERLGRDGWDVAVAYHHQKQAAEEVCATIVSYHRRAIAFPCDVSQNDQVIRLVDQIESTLGPIGVLVNNAGITHPQSLEELDESSWDRLISVNLKSVFLVTQACLPAMRRAGWGRIVNLSSAAAQLGGIVGPHYAASKAGIIGLTHSYARLLAAEGITVNAIAPALIETAMTDVNPRATPDLIPLKRLGHVDEVASVVSMLVANGYMTGQTISVNGGWYMTS